MSEIINVNELKPGVTFIQNNEPYIVIESTHSKSGRGQAHVKVKCKNLLTNSVNVITFTGGEKVDKAFVQRKDAQYLYLEFNDAIFMDDETFEQIKINLSKLKNEIKYIVEGTKVLIIIFQNKIIGIEIPKNVELLVTESSNAVKGNTVNNATKKVVLETGIEIEVPQFINKGQKIIVNTTNGKYLGKV